MANPFQAKFDSQCQGEDCGTTVYKGEDMFVDDGEFICENCAQFREIICDCGKKKKADFKMCYECFNEE